MGNTVLKIMSQNLPAPPIRSAILLKRKREARTGNSEPKFEILVVMREVILFLLAKVRGELLVVQPAIARPPVSTSQGGEEKEGRHTHSACSRTGYLRRNR